MGLLPESDTDGREASRACTDAAVDSDVEVSCRTQYRKNLRHAVGLPAGARGCVTTARGPPEVEDARGTRPLARRKWQARELETRAQAGFLPCDPGHRILRVKSSVVAALAPIQAAACNVAVASQGG